MHGPFRIIRNLPGRAAEVGGQLARFLGGYRGEQFRPTARDRMAIPPDAIARAIAFADSQSMRVP